MNALGEHQWVRSYTSCNNVQEDYDIHINTNGNVTLCGNLLGSLDFVTTAGTVSIGSSATTFVPYRIVYGPNGTLEYAQGIGEQNTSAQRIHSVFYENDAFYTAGHYYNGTDFDGSAATVSLDSSILGGFYAAKYDIEKTTNQFEQLLNEQKIYPNPTNGKVIIEFSNNQIQNLEDVFLFDYAGSRVSLNIERINSICTVDLSQFERGVYVLYFRINGILQSQTVLLQ